jgi:uncharacterized protein YyaL (SSP411 family)
MRIGALLVLAVVSCGGARGRAVAPSAAPPISWSKWNGDAFARAKREHKLVLVDVGIEGCTACRWMHEGTYRNADVVRRIQKDFVPVSVDADQQPDIGARYEPWGWPAEIFLTGDGAMALAIQGSEPAKEFIPILDRLAKGYADGTLAIEGKVVHGTPESGDAALDARCKDTVAMLDHARSALGWGGPFHVAEAPPVDLDYYRAASRGDAGAGAHALDATIGASKLIDPVWGGIYIAARTDTWDGPIHEKRMIHEAAALTNFAEALSVTHDAAWRPRIAAVDRYVRDFMTSPRGTFFSTQKDAPEHMPAGMNATRYFALDDAHRRAIGVPSVDHGIYTDQNGRVIAAYVAAWEATGDAAYLATATKAADALLAARTTPDGWLLQVKATPGLEADARYRLTSEEDRLYLKPQAEVGLALVALYGATADARYHDAALRIGKATRALEDPKDGGFFATTARDTDALVARAEPLEGNVQTARFFLRLAALTHDEAWRKSARRALARLGEREVRAAGLADQALFARALYELLGGFVEVSILGPDGDAKKALWTAAARLAVPRKLVHQAVPGTYPDRGKPTAYVCTPSECSSPMTDPAALAPAAAKVEKLPAAVCGGR